MKNTLNWSLNSNDLHLLELALKEDLGAPFNDLTTSLLFKQEQVITCARIISKNKQPIILSGLVVIKSLLAKFDEQLSMQSNFCDGDKLASGETLCTISGPAQSLWMIERTLLNFLQRLCGVATLTAKFVTMISHTKAKILDTRKTMPGLRHLDKYAVQCGGGVNHRMGLYDAIMLKDTHIDSLGGMEKTLAKLPKEKSVPVIVEVRTIEELDLALQQVEKITRVLLDNMPLPQIKESVARCKNKIVIEVSGNITLNNVLAVAECGVDFISVGQITHSAPHVDLSMKCDN